MFALRLKVTDKKIAEVETMVSRYAGTDVAFKPKALVSPNPMLTEMVPISERVSRDQIVVKNILKFSLVKVIFKKGPKR